MVSIVGAVEGRSRRRSGVETPSRPRIAPLSLMDHAPLATLAKSVVAPIGDRLLNRYSIADGPTDAWSATISSTPRPQGAMRRQEVHAKATRPTMKPEKTTAVPPSGAQPAIDGAAPGPRKTRWLPVGIGTVLAIRGAAVTTGAILSLTSSELPLVNLIELLLGLLTLWAGAILIRQGSTGALPLRSWRRFGILALASGLATAFFFATIYFVVREGLGAAIEAAPPDAWAPRLLKWHVTYWYLIPIAPIYATWIVLLLHIVVPEGLGTRLCRSVGYAIGVIFPIAMGLAVVAARWRLE